jgi:hypothetical protein
VPHGGNFRSGLSQGNSACRTVSVSEVDSTAVVYWCETQLADHHCVTFIWADAALDSPDFRDGLLTMREAGGYYPRDKNV